MSSAVGKACFGHTQLTTQVMASSIDNHLDLKRPALTESPYTQQCNFAGHSTPHFKETTATSGMLLSRIIFLGTDAPDDPY
eukprot:6460512-Amphidinium_carterae.1